MVPHPDGLSLNDRKGNIPGSLIDWESSFEPIGPDFKPGGMGHSLLLQKLPTSEPLTLGSIT